jgi:hypothetical protein
MSSAPLAHLRNMPLARCLRQHMNLAKRSIDPNTAELSTKCKQVRPSHGLRLAAELHHPVRSVPSPLLCVFGN